MARFNVALSGPPPPLAANSSPRRSSVNGRPAASSAASTMCLISVSSIVLIVRAALLNPLFADLARTRPGLRRADMNGAERFRLNDVDERPLDELEDCQERHRNADPPFARIEQPLKIDVALRL